jgi:hypothetical protein
MNTHGTSIERRSEFPECNTPGTGGGANRRSRFCLLGIYDWGQCGGDDRMLRWGVNVLDKLADIWYNTGRNGSLAQWI